MGTCRRCRGSGKHHQEKCQCQCSIKRENTIYHFNNITPVHLDLLDYKKDISNYQFVEEISSIENNTVLESDNNEIVLKYKKLANDKEDKINNPGTGTAIPFIFILIVILIGTIAISINKKKNNI